MKGLGSNGGFDVASRSISHRSFARKGKKMESANRAIHIFCSLNIPHLYVLKNVPSLFTVVSD